MRPDIPDFAISVANDRFSSAAPETKPTKGGNRFFVAVAVDVLKSLES